MFRKITITAACLVMVLVSYAGAQVQHKLTAANFSVEGGAVRFDVFIQALTSEPVYLSVSDMVLSFNAENFENSVFSYAENSCGLKNSGGNNADFYNSSISTLQSGNNLMISIPEINITSQADLQTLAAKIDNLEMTHKIGTFRITGIVNHEGTLGLSWIEQNTVIQSYEPIKFAVVNCKNAATYEVLEDAPLPVTLQSFTAGVFDSRSIRLSWVTASEINNAGFEVQRKSSEQETVNREQWKNIGFVDGNGNISTPTAYTFEDRKLNSGKYRYRLKQIDNNGNSEFYALSETIEIGIPKNFNLGQNYPNPFNPETKIDFELPGDARVKIIVFDVLGREMKTLVNETRKAGYYTINFNASGFASGTYFYRLDAEGLNAPIVKKLVYVK